MYKCEKHSPRLLRDVEMAVPKPTEIDVVLATFLQTISSKSGIIVTIALCQYMGCRKSHHTLKLQRLLPPFITTHTHTHTHTHIHDIHTYIIGLVLYRYSEMND